MNDKQKQELMEVAYNAAYGVLSAMEEKVRLIPWFAIRARQKPAQAV